VSVRVLVFLCASRDVIYFWQSERWVCVLCVCVCEFVLSERRLEMASIFAEREV